MTRRSRGFVAVVAACLVGGGAYVAWAATHEGAGAPEPASAAAIARVAAGPHLIFLTSASGKPPFNQVAIAPLGNLDDRLFVGLSCDRVAAVRAGGVCLRHSDLSSRISTVRFFDSAFSVHSVARAAGIPTRARISPSGRLAAATGFVTGDSYALAGQFSTATAIFSTNDGEPVVRNLEKLRVLRNGRRFAPVSRNFWGVTFVDDRRFYVSMGVAPNTYLMRGDLSTQTLTVLRENVECPALSPDGSRIAFKQRDLRGEWRFSVVELLTGRTIALAEKRSIDDQLAWLDSQHLLYEVDHSTWIVNADGSGQPRLLLDHARSATAVR